MKFIHLLSIVILCFAVPFTSCEDSDKKRLQDEARQALPKADPNAVPTTTAPVPPPSSEANSPAQNAAGVYHYTCTKGCAGGAAGAGNCAMCGSPLAHNQAYHNNSATTTPTTPTTPITPPPSNANSPAQNAAGVYHYTCTKGCAGGAAGAGNCSMCGSPLAHNQAYHN